MLCPRGWLVATERYNWHMNVSDATKAFLESLQRYDLALLIGACRVDIDEFEVKSEWGWPELVVSVSIGAPVPIDEALTVLTDFDRKRIAEAAASSTKLTAPTDISVSRLSGAEPAGSAPLLAELIIQRATMISVATGGKRIQDVDDYYVARQSRILNRMPATVAYENGFASLWDWYAYWKDNLATYADRRKYLRELFGTAIEGIATRPAVRPATREPTGWERVDRALIKARGALDTAQAEEDWQAIGLLCREATISLAQAVYDAAIHEPLDGVVPSSTDANRMLEGFFAHAFAGPSNKEVRAHARASLALALNLQHRRTATRQLAALCVEATSSTAAVISIIARPHG